MSLIPDSVKETFADLLQTYSDVERIKMQTRLARAQASAAAMELADRYSNSQAKAGDATKTPGGGLSGGGMLLAGLAVGLAVYLLVKD